MLRALIPGRQEIALPLPGVTRTNGTTSARPLTRLTGVTQAPPPSTAVTLLSPSWHTNLTVRCAQWQIGAVPPLLPALRKRHYNSHTLPRRMAGQLGPSQSPLLAGQRRCTHHPHLRKAGTRLPSPPGNPTGLATPKPDIRSKPVTPQIAHKLVPWEYVHRVDQRSPWRLRPRSHQPVPPMSGHATC